MIYAKFIDIHRTTERLISLLSNVNKLIYLWCCDLGNAFVVLIKQIKWIKLNINRLLMCTNKCNLKFFGERFSIQFDIEYAYTTSP